MLMINSILHFIAIKSIFNIESLKTDTYSTVFCLLGEPHQIFTTILKFFLLVFVTLVCIIIFDVHVPVPHVDTRDCFHHRRDSLKIYCRCGKRKKKMYGHTGGQIYGVEICVGYCEGRGVPTYLPPSASPQPLPAPLPYFRSMSSQSSLFTLSF